jgi:CRP-like cAMP-binding protein
VLIEPRAAGSGMFVIAEGTVVVQPRDVDPVELGAGEVVGELALLTEDGTRTARVQAVTEVRCLTLDRATLQQALEDEPKLAIALLQAAVERLAAQILS